jgi:hypothetical protein
LIHARIWIHTVVNTKITVFCDVTSCCLVDGYYGSGGLYCPHLHSRRLHEDEVAGFSETQVRHLPNYVVCHCTGP